MKSAPITEATWRAMAIPRRQRLYRRAGNLLGLVFYFGLLGFDADALMTNVEAEPAEQAHVHIRHPDQRKAGDHVTAPIVIQHGEPRDEEPRDCDVVAKAVLAGEQEEKLALPETATTGAPGQAPFPWFPEYLFVSHRPGDARDRYCEEKQVDDLRTKGHERHAGWGGSGRRGGN